MGAGTVKTGTAVAPRPGPKKKLKPLSREEEAFLMRELEWYAGEKEKRWCEYSIIQFMKRAWREIGEFKPLEINWHHKKIATHLRRITFGKERHLIINVPPRHSKSSLVNIIWPAWVWIQPKEKWGPLCGPHVKFLSVSYGATLSEELAVKMRRLVMGDWYQKHWGHQVKLRSDQQSRANFGNEAGGERMSSSIEGGLLGRGADILICDDPQDRKGADSEAQSRASIQGMSDLTTRITDPRTSARVLIMQRLTQFDATDWALKNWPKDTVHLMFPARFEADRACEDDPRTYDGELLWPAVWTEEELTKIERGLSALDGDILSDFAIAGQMQQRPIPRGGGIIGPDDWQIWPEHVPRVEDLTISKDGSAYVPLPPVSYVVLALDTAMSERETADWNACVVIGVWHRPRQMTRIVGHEDGIDDGEQPRAILMGGWRRRCKLNDETLGRDGRPLGLVQLVADTCRRFPVDRIIIENKTRGLDVKNELERQFASEMFNIQLFEPGRHGDKVARLYSIQPLFSQGLVYCPAKCSLTVGRDGREEVEVAEFEWARQIQEEVSNVPRGTNDDFSDALCQAMISLREDGFLSLTKEYIQQQVAMRMLRPKRDTVRIGYGV